MPKLVSAAIDVEAPLVTEGMKRDILLRALQKKIYFEKTVAASYAANNPKHCAMPLPAWFVAEHGDKFQQSVLLRSGSSKGSWRVQLSIGLFPPCSRPEVKFCGGWRAFATANGLAVGDSLIFCLRAMSEFDVYVFRETKSSIQPTSVPAPRKRSRNFELLEEKVNKSVGRRRRILVAEKSAGRVISKNFFEKTLTACAVSRSYQLTLPTGFMHQYADKIRQHVALQSVADRKMWTVKVNIYFPDNRPQFMFDCGAWKAFVVFNGLVEGDRVIFTLVATSTFQVLILRGDGNPNAVRPSLQLPVKRSNGGSSFSQTWQPPAKSLRPQHRDLAGKSSVKMERELGSELLAEKEDAADSVGANSASDSSRSPSDVDSPTFKRWCQRMGIKQEDLSTSFNDTICHAQSRNAAPLVLK